LKSQLITWPGHLKSGTVPAKAEKAVSILVLTIALLNILLGLLSLGTNNLEAFPVPCLWILAGNLFSLAVCIDINRGYWPRGLLITGGIIILLAITLLLLPEHIHFSNIHGIIHHSLISALALLAAGVTSAGLGLRYLFGDTPYAEDVSRYPLLLAPIFIVFALYAFIIIYVGINGFEAWDWNVILRSFDYSTEGATIGMLSHILGTLLLVVMTTVISLPVGMGVGIFLAEYSGRSYGFLSQSITLIRSISLLILALGALSLVYAAKDTSMATVFGNFPLMWRGSFMNGALFLSLLIIPVIARVTEEGCRSLPVELREGSHALGASEGHMLMHVLIPWSAPNILTGLLLGAAEVMGSVAVLMLIAGTGEGGVGLFNEVSSLALYVFHCSYGVRHFAVASRPYQYTAALILPLMTMGLSLATVFIRRKFAARYRGN
jgi:phosphate transport system permease protein